MRDVIGSDGAVGVKPHWDFAPKKTEGLEDDTEPWLGTPERKRKKTEDKNKT